MELQINQLSLEQIEILTRRFLDFNNVNDLVDWLKNLDRKHRQVGSAAGQIWMAPDFDAALDDFQEYM